MNFFNRLTRAQKIGLIFLVLVVVDSVKGAITAVSNQNWSALGGIGLTLAILAGVGYYYRDLIGGGWAALKQRREKAREEFEKSGGNIALKDAALFSLSWSREIYGRIPHDRKPLVRSSFLLIAIAMGLFLLQLESISLLPMLASAALILAGVNLLVWVVGSEREEKDLIRIELETARRMQMSLMPAQDPIVKGFDISGCCIPARDVGGDLFDFVWTGEKKSKLCISVVDVSGKGMDAALTAVYTSGALVSEAQHQEDVVTVIKNLNTAIYSRQNRGRFVSMLMAQLDVASGGIRYVNAGQARPMLLRDGKVDVLRSPGARFPLGVVEAPVYQAADIPLRPGDYLLFCTDGATEAMNAKDEIFGEERLIDLFTRTAYRYHRASETVDALRDNILGFSGAEYQHDDLTLVVVRAL